MVVLAVGTFHHTTRAVRAARYCRKMTTGDIPEVIATNVPGQSAAEDTVPENRNARMPLNPLRTAFRLRLPPELATQSHGAENDLARPNMH
jgi:hypothetical protein